MDSASDFNGWEPGTSYRGRSVSLSSSTLRAVKPRDFRDFLRRITKKRATMLTTKRTPMATPTAMPIVLLPLSDVVGAVPGCEGDKVELGGGKIITRFEPRFSGHIHWEREKFPRSQSTIRYLQVRESQTNSVNLRIRLTLLAGESFPV